MNRNAHEPDLCSTLVCSSLRGRASWALALALSVAACSATDGSSTTYFGPSQTGGAAGEPPSSGGGGGGGTAGQVPGSGGASTGGAAGAPGSGGQTSGGAGGTAGTGGTGGTGGSTPCYQEVYYPTVGLSDLSDSYSAQTWLPSMLGLLDRRHPNGFALLDEMKSDPWLVQDFPQYFDLQTWDGMILAIDTACHEETHGWDYEHALDTPGKHAFYLRADLTVTAAKLGFFPRSEILGDVQQGGSVTSIYDDYLVGEEGSYDFIALADELNAYINGLACATAAGDQFDAGSARSYRDGVAAHALFLLYYLKVAREDHPALYGEWQADADWQRFVRLSWARARFWTDKAKAFPTHGISDDEIWARVNRAENLAELGQFTSQPPDDVACHP